MIGVFFGLSCGLAFLLFVGIFWLRRFKNEIRLYIQLLFGVALITAMWNAFAVTVNAAWLSALFFGIYLASTDWLVVVLLTFVQKYTESFEENRVIKTLTYIGCAIDTVSMVLNTWTQHIFTVERTVTSQGELCNVMIHKVPVYRIHLVFVYVIAMLSLLTLITKTFQTVKLYRKKYEFILFSLIAILAANMAYRFVDFIPADISPLLYILLAIAIAYFTLMYVPQGLMVKLLSYSIQDVDIGILCFDKDGRCIYVNQWVRDLIDKENHFAGMEDFMAEWGDCGKKIGEKKEDSWQMKRRIADQSVYMEMQYNPLLDEKGHYIGCYFLMKDETEAVEKLKCERYRATHDELTGIYNQKRFCERVKEKLKDDSETERYIVVSNIKDFKLVNELFGKERGDEILIQLAQMLRENTRFDSVFGRLGSDMFAICVRKEYYEEEMFIRFAQEVEDLAQTDVYRMHVHVGVYRILDPEIEVSVMCDRALLAIHKIKDSYSQNIAYYDDVLWSELHQQNMIISEFDAAISEKQFQMFLQPQISSGDLSLLGAEALVRWKHPEKGMMPPGIFIEVLEKTGLIYRLDSYIWEAACIQLKKWKEEGQGNLHISVNISQKDFYFIDIYKTFVGLVEKYQIDPLNLKLEITETAIMADLQKTISVLSNLREYGFQIEIDDFGSGYSSLNTLKDINVNVLKLDMGFLRETEQNEKNRVIMDAIIAMAKKLNLLTVAEGVETPEQVEYLKKAGCDIFQGYYFSKPLPVSEFEEKYLKRKSDYV
ncbi:MAG: EAL domain-containing protein [Clostridiaceae bacterium]|nr:EAL domain-containing protein [Clostridiaceae bacterium]